MTRNSSQSPATPSQPAQRCDKCGGVDRREFAAGELAPAACRCPGGPA